MQHRLEANTRDKAGLVEEASSKILELEKKVAEGEVQRRLMHNTIQVGRGWSIYFSKYRKVRPYRLSM